MTAFIFLATLLVLIALGMPIAFALLLSGVAVMLQLDQFDSQIVVQNAIGGADNFVLMAVPFALTAALLAFSRVYLSQHFTQDALAGSTLGTLSGIVVHHWLYRSAFANKRWLTRYLLRRQNQ